VIEDCNNEELKALQHIGALADGNTKGDSSHSDSNKPEIQETLSPSSIIGGEDKEEERRTTISTSNIEKEYNNCDSKGITSPPINGNNGNGNGNEKESIEAPNPILEDIYVAKGISEYQPLIFADPVELLFYLDENIATGKIKLHDWQMETLIFLAQPYSFENRLKFLLTAANGSGKDAYILAAFAVWQLVTKVRSRFIGTSKSAHQLNTQTNPYIKNMCARLGGKLKKEGWHPQPFIYRSKPFQIICNFTGAEILNFVTDEAENIEGYHPPQDCPGADLTIALNEAKGIPDEYFEGFSRCTYNRWIEVTSPGRMSGKNWEHYSRSTKYPNPHKKGEFYSRKVTSYDCPHKSAKSIEEDAIDFGGRESELFRSKHLAEYTSIGENIIITLEIIDKWITYPPPFDGRHEWRGGLDLSLGGDETVLAVREGNATRSIDGVRIKDAPTLESYLDKLMQNRGLVKGRDLVFTDAGGLGKPIAQNLAKLGWKIIYVFNHGTPIGLDKNFYRNRGTEIYFEVCNYLARGYIIPKADTLWREQLGSRKYMRPDNEKFFLQPKAQLDKDDDKKTLSRSKEWTSPDRADAWVLCFADFIPLELKNKADEAAGRQFKRITQKELVSTLNNEKYRTFDSDSGLRRRAPEDKRIANIKRQFKELGYGNLIR